MLLSAFRPRQCRRVHARCARTRDEALSFLGFMTHDRASTRCCKWVWRAPVVDDHRLACQALPGAPYEFGSTNRKHGQTKDNAISRSSVPRGISARASPSTSSTSPAAEAAAHSSRRNAPGCCLAMPAACQCSGGMNAVHAETSYPTPLTPPAHACASSTSRWFANALWAGP